MTLTLVAVENRKVKSEFEEIVVANTWITRSNFFPLNSTAMRVGVLTQSPKDQHRYQEH